MIPSDHDLLRAYARDGAEAAFTELVRRHVDLVYSAALRQVRSPDLARDVAQSVFLDLARRAATLHAGPSLAAWLHVVTRRTAIDLIRRESRRHAREQAAAASAMDRSPSTWSQIEPLLDRAVEQLNPTDRAAVLLRFFENKSLREIGTTLGLSEDAAQKRVSRALDQLRTRLTRRGVAVTSAALATDLSAHALLTAPASLTPAITSAVALATSAAGDATLVHVTQTLAMTTLQKTAATAAAVLALGAGLYGAREFLTHRAELHALQAQADQLAADTRQLRERHAAAARDLHATEQQIDALLAARPSAADLATEADLRAWLGRVDRLKQLFRLRPDLAIPELQLLGDDAWFNAAKDAQFDTDAQIRDALAQLRNAAESKFAVRMGSALGAYVQHSGGQLPADVTLLLPFFDPPIDPSLLQRYEMLRTGAIVDGNRRREVIGQKAPVDLERDHYWCIGPGSFSIDSFLHHAVQQARSTYARANDGRDASEATQLLPYLKWPANPAAVQKVLNPPTAATP